MSKLTTKLKERFAGHSYDSPCDNGCYCGIVFCTTHEPYTSCLVDDPELYLALLRHQEQVTGLVPTDLEASKDSSNSPTEATQERKDNNGTHE